MLKEIYADLHIHIGRTEKGRAVKITGSKNLTLKNILETATSRKGLDLIGIIDCHSPEVIEEIEQLIREGKAEELMEGGVRFENTTLLMGSEIEIYDEHCHGPIHVLCYMPTIKKMKDFSNWMSTLQKNIHLSSQRIYCDGRTLQQKVHELNGLFIPAHVFTPFKSLFGRGVNKSLSEVFDPSMIDAIELGLSSDTDLVKGMSELAPYTFVTNSDAHSLGKLAREYQKMKLADANFEELKKVLHQQEGRTIVANYGLNPLLGKYHETVCANCGEQITEAGHTRCPYCGKEHLIKGVAKRIRELSDAPLQVVQRPPYIHQVPLDFIPGIGPKTIDKLIHAFGTEMNILHKASVVELKAVLPEKLATTIDLARTGQLGITVGGGGVYGKIDVD
ncbi:TIGR00375 family protein [Lysinibacillus sp. 2017]|uniref:endonuclease Q family protein n=1 Tax=unclassified Lysinibacillus TaxID=2636778 RepID=UPI000D5280C7|nr:MULTISPECIES: endonuclease Q family protein [unclassified Lysinibacillus]AWE08543.1 TIGR00375 family protein [Lysinibacillus sp. 2017]TGN35634.1 TIGR00375 family protein [Lysinibacillus sp. S2017]